MNQSETDLGIANESQLLGFGISGNIRAIRVSRSLRFFRSTRADRKKMLGFLGGEGIYPLTESRSLKPLRRLYWQILL